MPERPIAVGPDLDTGGPQGRLERRQVVDRQGGVGLAGGPEILLHAQMQRHGPVGEPATATGGERRGFAEALESEHTGIEGLCLVLPTGGHGQLHVVQTHDLERHDGLLTSRAIWPSGPWTASLPHVMGSLIKKRRKRMRKKKHKKMLKATRWQRRAGK